MEEPGMRNQQIDPTRLGQVVSQMLGSDLLRIKEWNAQPIYGGLDKNNALIRCQGVAEAGAQTLRWSLVIKVISKVLDNDDPAGYQYWKREALAYQSGLFERLPKNLAAPRCFAVDEQSDASIWIWMEDIHDDFEGIWPLEFYGQVAYQLGLYNGVFLVGMPLPSEEWISRRWLRGYVERAAPMVGFIRNHPHHPVVRSLYGNNLLLILATWEIRSDLLDILEKMPQVFCHQDAFKRNMFCQQGKLIAIDWSFSGNAPVGSELAPLVATSLAFGDIPADKIHELEQLCVDSYQKGLTEAGARIPTRTIRRCFVLSVLLRYIFGANIGDVLPALLDESRHTWVEQGFGQSVEETSKLREGEARYYLSIFMQALKFMGLKPLLKLIGYLLLFSLPGRKPA